MVSLIRIRIPNIFDVGLVHHRLINVLQKLSKNNLEQFNDIATDLNGIIFFLSQRNIGITLHTPYASNTNTD